MEGGEPYQVSQRGSQLYSLGGYGKNVMRQQQGPRRDVARPDRGLRGWCDTLRLQGSMRGDIRQKKKKTADRRKEEEARD